MRVTLLSNGYGEDEVGVRLARALLAQDARLTLQAFPTVGLGRAYARASIPVIGPRRALPSGGLTMHTPAMFAADIRSGLLGLTLAQSRALREVKTDLLITIGDAYALLISRLVKARVRFYVQTLVSAYHAPSPRDVWRLNRLFMERFTLPERLLMRGVTHCYVRDRATEALLRAYPLTGLGAKVSALGNPMLDGLEPRAPLELPLTRPVIALLPGSRSYRDASLDMMVRALAHYPEATGLVAWTGEAPPAGAAWRALERGIWTCGEKVFLLTNAFNEVLAASQLALATAGTASEQAAALGKPLVSFALPPHFSAAFLANQKRLLGDALTLEKAEPRRLAQALKTLLRDQARFYRAATVGRARMGEPGGSAAIARDVLDKAAERA